MNCKPADKKPAGSVYSVIVNDFRGREVSLKEPATRIVCLIESALSGLYMLKAEDRVVGVSTAVYNESVAEQYAVLDERISNKKLPAPGNWDFAGIENIVALQPDLVIIWASQTEATEAIEKHGIPVYAVFLSSLDDVYREIADLGILTGMKERADSLINYTRNEISLFADREKPAGTDRKSVYFMWSQGLLETAGINSTVNEVIDLAGARNSCSINQEHVIINKEKLFDWNPDVWVMWYNSAKDPEDILNLAELKSINAIRNRQVYELPSVFMCDLWTLKFSYAVKLLAKWCYPATFADLDTEEEKTKMLIALYGEKGAALAR